MGIRSESIEQAVNALRLALRSLDEGDMFNIVGFGSSVERIFAQSRPYTQASLDEATRLLEGWDADLGGTELLAPLEAVIQGAEGELPRRVMLLTDGQVSNEAECIALAAKHAAFVRIFTFGIGYGASEHLVKGLARAAGGKAEFIHPNERIEPVVMRQFARAAAPCLGNVRIDWSALEPELVTPSVIPGLFDADLLTVYARVPATANITHAEVSVLADGPQGTMRFPVRVDLREPAEMPMVPALMARAAIRELEDGRTDAAAAGSRQRARRKKTSEEKVLELALRYQLLSSQTSFVAVEERVEGAQSERAQLRRVPVALTHGWGGVERALSASVCYSMASPAPDFRDPGMSTVRLAAASAPDFHVSAELNEPVDAFGAVPRFARSSGHSLRSRAPKPDVPVDSFMLLTLSQRADGSFSLDAAVQREFGLEPSALERAAEQLGGSAAAAAVVHTAVALALLERRFADREDEWRMLADKARRWLARQGVALPKDQCSWVAWAAVTCAL